MQIFKECRARKSEEMVILLFDVVSILDQEITTFSKLESRIDVFYELLLAILTCFEMILAV